MKKLYLASKSPSRRMLLEEARISYTLIEQNADELLCDWTLPFEQLTQSIALFKMDHAVLPAGKENDLIFVLTADSLVQDKSGMIHGKPLNRHDALEKIKKIREGGRCGTTFCLDRKIFIHNAWKTQERITQTVIAEYYLDIGDEWLEYYLDRSPIALQAAGGFAVEGFGSQFIKSIHGSATTVIGLPVCEVRKALQKLGFFNNIS